MNEILAGSPDVDLQLDLGITRDSFLEGSVSFPPSFMLSKVMQLVRLRVMVLSTVRTRCPREEFMVLVHPLALRNIRPKANSLQASTGMMTMTKQTWTGIDLPLDMTPLR